MTRQYDAVVIGGGPAGVTAMLYLLRGGAKAALVEKLAPGGQLLLTEHLENYPGFVEPVKGYELADNISRQIEPYPHDKFYSEVKEIVHEPGANRLLIGDEWVEAKAVIIASGTRHRRIGLPDEERFIGKGISFCALCDGNFYRNATIGVVGGGNSALEESLYLSRIASKVHLIHRRDKFRADDIYVRKVIDDPKIELEYNNVVTALHGETLLEGVTLKNVLSGEERTLPLEGLFVFTGFDPVSEFFPAGIKVDDRGFIITDTEMQTNLPGIFAAGDIRSKHCRQVITAAGDGATAAHSARLYLESLNA
ncbi:MAG: thioredoxin-disulfide reductase [Desulfovibrionaceae bacterium]|nr:thioredoxin-disulfide reductase [Desulfovibrionaceae bacterium]